MRPTSSAMILFSAFWAQTTVLAVTLIDTNGISITGEISSYSPRTGMVKIKKAEKTSTHPLSSFNTESQDNVILWRSDRNFKRESNLNITFRRHYTESSSNVVDTVEDIFTKKEKEATLGTITRQLCTHKISIKNESDTPFKDLTVDYRVFFTQYLHPEYTGQFQFAGTSEYDTLDPETTWSFETNPFLCAVAHEPARGIRWRRPYDSSSTILGILLRIRKPGLTEEWIEQEIEIGEVPRERDRSDYQKVYK